MFILAPPPVSEPLPTLGLRRWRTEPQFQTLQEAEAAAALEKEVEVDPRHREKAASHVGSTPASIAPPPASAPLGPLDLSTLPSMGDPEPKDGRGASDIFVKLPYVPTPARNVPKVPRLALPVASALENQWLVVRYDEQEVPMLDIQRLDGGAGRHVIVAAVKPGGAAELAGVRPGHALVSINGGEDFRSLPGWQVRLMLVATPMTLTFDTDPPPEAPLEPEEGEHDCMCECHEKRFVEAEKRPLGISSYRSVCGPSDIVGDLVVFRQGPTPLLLYSPQAPLPQYSRLQGSASGGAYELRRDEAHKLVAHSLRGALAGVEPAPSSARSGKGSSFSTGIVPTYFGCGQLRAASPSRPSIPSEGYHHACLVSSVGCGITSGRSQATQAPACGRSFGVCSTPRLLQSSSTTVGTRRTISHTYI